MMPHGSRLPYRYRPERRNLWHDSFQVVPPAIQRQQGKPSTQRRFLNRPHQSPAQPPAAAGPMHQQLRHLRPMRLIRRPRRLQLHRPNNLSTPLGIPSDEENRTRMRRGERPSPPLLRPLNRQWQNKTHRRPGLHRIHQKPCERTQIRLVLRVFSLSSSSLKL